MPTTDGDIGQHIPEDRPVRKAVLGMFLFYSFAFYYVQKPITAKVCRKEVIEAKEMKKRDRCNSKRAFVHCLVLLEWRTFEGSKTRGTTK